MPKTKTNCYSKSWKIKALCLLLALVLAAAGCGSSQVKVEKLIAPYGEAEITISGLTEEDYVITPAELAQMELTSLEASGTRANGQKETASPVGVLLETFVAQYGYTQTDFKRVRFYAIDDYNTYISPKTLRERQVLLALTEGGQALREDYRPLRIVIPGLEANQWIYMVNKISFELETATTETVPGTPASEAAP